MPGEIGWVDLTVPDAVAVRDFYMHVTGWTASPVDMGGYADFNMTPAGASVAVGGICHARGENRDLPPVWLIYITVADIEESVRQCEARGGKLLLPIKTMGAHGRYCVIEDPAGAAAGLFEKAG
jgi:predicted enzyme related to lactoylglutathione lyase